MKIIIRKYDTEEYPSSFRHEIVEVNSLVDVLGFSIVGYYIDPNSAERWDNDLITTLNRCIQSGLVLKYAHHP